MEYPIVENQVVFLKDTDIVQDINGNNVSHNAVISNGIASYDLVSAISGVTSADVDFLSGKLSALSGRFDDEQAYTSAALRYQGEVTLSNEYNYGSITVNKKLVALIVSNSNISSHTANLNAGFLFKAVAGDPTSSVYEFDDIVLHPNDYIFINKNKDAVSDITYDDINIIRDYDLSVSNLQTAVNVLTATISGDAIGLISQISSISSDVITADDSLSAKVGKISTDVIDGDSSLSNKFETAICNIITGDNSLSNNFKSLSDELCTFVNEQHTYNLDAVRFRGTVKLNDRYYEDPTNLNVQVRSGEELYGLLLTDTRNTAGMTIPKGWMFKTIADDEDKSYKVNGKDLHANEYIIINNDVAPLAEIELSDVSIIKDYDLSVENLSGQVKTLETAVSADGTGLISKLDKLSTDLLNEDLGEPADPTKLGLIPTISNDLSTLSSKVETSANDLTNAITGISNTISAPAIGINAKIEQLSTSIITADNSLSNKFKNLSTNLLNEDLGTEEDPKKLGLIPELCTTVTATLSTKLTNFISTTEISVGDLSDAITAIHADIKGGVNYQGHLKLTQWHEISALSDYVAGLYENYSSTHDEETLSIELSNGWMYYIDYEVDATVPDGDEEHRRPHPGITPTGAFRTAEKDGSYIEFVPGNYIIVHSHPDLDNNIPAGDSVTLSTLGRNNIDIIRVTDSDLVRRNELALSVDNLCSILSNEISTGRNDTSSWVKNTVSSSIYERLTTEIGDRGTADQFLSDVISNETTGLCGTISTIDFNLATSASQLDRDIKFVSSELTTTVSTAIDDKIQISTFGNPTLTSVDKLQIVNIPAAEYARQLTAGTTLSDAIYKITDKELNAFNERVVNVASPTADADATNKKYVDDNINALSVPQLSTRFDNAFTTGEDNSEILTLFNDGHSNNKYQLLMLDGTLVLRPKNN